jgi:signal transduction histidine kinase
MVDDGRLTMRLRLRSIRWRLPLSYAAIALLATLALGVVLLTTLRSFYVQREIDYLHWNAEMLSLAARDMLKNDTPTEAIQAQFESLSFLSQVHIRLLDANRQVVADSGVPDNRQVVVSYERVQQSIAGQFSQPSTRAGDYASVIFLRSPLAPAAPSSPGLFVAGQSAEQRQFNLQFGSADTGPVQDVIMPGPPFGHGITDAAFSNRRSDQQVEAAVVDDGDEQTLLGYIEVLEGPAYGSTILDSVTRGWLIAGAVAVLLAGGVGWLVSRTMSAPLLALTGVTAQMAEGNLSARADVDRHDEFGILARTFNEMANRVEDTVVTLRRFVGDAAHELHTPLTALTANLELAVSEDNEEKRQTFITQAQQQVKRLETLTIGLLDLSRIEMNIVSEEKHLVNLTALIQETIELYASRAEQAGLTFVLDLDDSAIMAHVNESQFRRVIGNLLDNAIKFTPEDGTITLGMRRRDQAVELWVKDTGIGIPGDDLPQLFNRFHRGRNAAAYPGNGLGLAIIKAIVESHRGQVVVESAAESGTRFSLQLPVTT